MQTERDDCREEREEWKSTTKTHNHTSPAPSRQNRSSTRIIDAMKPTAEGTEVSYETKISQDEAHPHHNNKYHPRKPQPYSQKFD